MTESNCYHLLLEMTPSFYLENILQPTESTSLTDFLDLAKKVVRCKWADYMVSVFNNLPESQQKTKLFNIFGSEANLRQIFDQEKFRELEMLRLCGENELWRDIVLAISEREMASISLAKIWIEKLTDEQIEKLSLSKNEINLFLDLSLEVQEVIDHAYIKQLELADAPDGKQIGPHAKEFGYEYLYDEKIPYIDIFPDEFTRLVNTLESFSKRVANQVSSGELAPQYLDLSSYLKKLAESFGSRESDHLKVLGVWKDISIQYVNLAISGCPIILTPWGFPADGNHVGIELMVTINLGESSPWYKVSQEYLAIAGEFMKNYDPNFVPIPFIHQYVFTRNGLNIPWSGTACASDNYIVFYDNENDNFGAALYHSYFSEFMDSTTSEERFSRVRGINTVAHETGHLCRMLDEDLYKKMGIGVSVNKIDEAKADTMANLFFLIKLKSNSFIDFTPEEFIEQYIVDYIDELRNSKGYEEEDMGIIWYSFSAKVCLIKLFESDSIIWSGDKIKIVDGRRGVEALAEVGQEIFNLYGSAEFNDEEVSRYVSALEEKARTSLDIQRFQNKVDKSEN